MTHIDLHTHSRYSHDGEHAPSRLVEMAQERGIGHLAVADHNRAIAVREALAAAKNTSVTVIPCIELDCDYEDAHLHLLGYFIDHLDPVYDELWTETRNRGEKLNRLKLERSLQLGFHLDAEAVLQKTVDGVLTDIVIATDILSDPRNRDNAELAPYREGGSKARDPVIHFCWDYLNKGGAAYVPGGYPTLVQAVDLVASTGGTPILAHPGANITGMEHYLPGIIQSGVRGVEAYCNYHSEEQARYWRKAALDHNVIFTCGSDYHGKVKPSIEMGSHGADGQEERILESLLGLCRRCA